MFPDERSLIEELKDEPFALLGVNSDPLERARRSEKENNLTWRSFWDGGDARGPIATRWGITGWPSIYVLDEEGVVRFHGVRGEEMDRVVKSLLAEMKKDEAGSEPESD